MKSLTKFLLFLPFLGLQGMFLEAASPALPRINLCVYDQTVEKDDIVDSLRFFRQLNAAGGNEVIVGIDTLYGKKENSLERYLLTQVRGKKIVQRMFFWVEGDRQAFKGPDYYYPSLFFGMPGTKYSQIFVPYTIWRALNAGDINPLGDCFARNSEIYLLSCFAVHPYTNLPETKYALLLVLAAWLLPIGGTVYGPTWTALVMSPFRSQSSYTFMVEPHAVKRVALCCVQYRREKPRQVFNNLFFQDNIPGFRERVKLKLYWP